MVVPNGATGISEATVLLVEFSGLANSEKPGGTTTLTYPTALTEKTLVDWASDETVATALRAMANRRVFVLMVLICFACVWLNNPKSERSCQLFLSEFRSFYFDRPKATFHVQMTTVEPVGCPAVFFKKKKKKLSLNMIFIISKKTKTYKSACAT